MAMLQRCQAGSEDAFRELVEKYQKRTYWIAYTMLHNYDSAREVSQDAFVRVFRNIARFDVQKNFYTWLYQIVVNLSIDRLRRASHAKMIDIDGVGGLPDVGRRSPLAAGEHKELRGRVHVILDHLPERYKTVLNLRDIQGFSCKEIAAIVECSNATVRWRLHRARKLFREMWEGRRAPAVAASASPGTRD